MFQRFGLGKSKLVSWSNGRKSMLSSLLLPSVVPNPRALKYGRHGEDSQRIRSSNSATWGFSVL